MANAAPSSPSAGPSRLGKNAFFFIIVTVFIDMMAFAVIMPSMPELIAEMLNGEATLEAARHLKEQGIEGPFKAMIAEAIPWGGYITTVYAVMNFLAQPVLGNLSDRFGRRPVLLVSMAMLAIDFVIMGLAHAIWLLFLGRFLSGHLCGALIPPHRPTSRTPPNRISAAQAFGMLGAAFGLGFILGPAIGGWLGEFDPRWPFFAAAGLAAINFCYGTLRSAGIARPRTPPQIRLEARQRLWRLPALHEDPLPRLVPGRARSLQLRALGLPVDIQLFRRGPVCLDSRHDRPGADGCRRLLGARSRASSPAAIIKTFGATRTAVFGFVVCALTFAAYGASDTGLDGVRDHSLGALGGVLGPAHEPIMTTRVPRNAQGELQGAIASVQALASIFAPFMLTQTLHYFTTENAPVYFPGAAFTLAAVVCAISLLPADAGPAHGAKDRGAARRSAGRSSPGAGWYSTGSEGCATIGMSCRDSRSGVRLALHDSDQCGQNAPANCAFDKVLRIRHDGVVGTEQVFQPSRLPRPLPAPPRPPCRQ